MIKDSLAEQTDSDSRQYDFGPMGINAAGNKPKLLAFWQQLAERYQDQPNSVLFEILNEPNGQLDVPTWNALFKECLAKIRQTNPSLTSSLARRAGME